MWASVFHGPRYKWQFSNLAISTTTLNLFKVNHKAYIPGFKLGLEAPFNFTEMQKQLKTLSFHF